MNGKTYQKQNGVLVDITPRVAALGGSGGKTYSGVAPIVVNNTSDTVSIVPGSKSVKGAVQAGTNIDADTNGVLSVKPWGDYEADHTDVNVNDLQDGAIVVTEEPIGSPTAVLAEIEQTLTTSALRVPSSAAVSDALAGAGVTPYTGIAPINVNSSTNQISAAAATTSAKGVVQVGDNVTVSNGIISVKPWTGHEAASTDIVPANYQDGAIVETDEPVGGSATAVLAEVEQSLTNAAGKVPSSAAVRAALAKKADVLAELYVSPTGSDDNDGLTAATALATPQEAMNRIHRSSAYGPAYVEGFPELTGTVAVHIAAGSYTGDMLLYTGHARVFLGGAVTITGMVFSNTAAALTIAPEEGVAASITCSAVSAQLMAVLTISGVDVTTGSIASGWGSYLSLEGSTNTLSITTTGDTSALNSTQNSSLRLRVGTVIIDSTAMNSTSHYVVNARCNSTIYYRPTTVTISFTRAAGAFGVALNSAILLESSGSTTITGTVNIGTAASSGSSLLVRTSGTHTMSGTVTGRRYFVDLHSYMRPSATTNKNFFPGSTDGTADSTTYGIYK